MSKVANKIHKVVVGSWIGEAGSTRRKRLDDGVRARQGDIRKHHDREAVDVPPFNVCDLASRIREASQRLVEHRSQHAPFQITVACALLGELCGTALIHDIGQAGHIYPRSKVCDDDWLVAHEPLNDLRNAIFHPGAILPRKNAENSEGGGPVGCHVDVLATFLFRQRREPGARELADKLRKSNSQIGRESVALWAVKRAVGMGNYELDRLRA